MAKANTKASAKPHAKRPAPGKAKPAASKPAASATKKKPVAAKASAKASAKVASKKPAPAKASRPAEKKVIAKARPAAPKKATAAPLKPVKKPASATKTVAPAAKTVASTPKTPAPPAPAGSTGKTPSAATPKAAPKPALVVPKAAVTQVAPPPPPAAEISPPTKTKSKAEPARKPAVPAQPAQKPAAQEKVVPRKVINLDEIKLPPGYRPSANEEYMNPMHLAYFKQKLDHWREELIAESQETLEHLRTETRDVGDEAERASRESDNILELRTRDRYRKLLRKIEEAIKRIEDGNYGYCEETGEEIGLGRLEARPIATLTVDAQERREMFQKQFRDDH